MADNVTLNPGVGGSVVATDDVSGAQFQRVKLDYGGDGVSSPVTDTTPLPVVSGVAPGVPVSGSASANNTNLLSMECLQYRAILVQVTDIGGGATISFQGSDDNTNWVSIAAWPLHGTIHATSTTAVGAWVVSATARYFRLRNTAYTSGTQSAVAIGLPHAPPLPITVLNSNQSINVSQLGASTIATNVGAASAGTIRVAIATDGQGQVADNAAFTDGTTRLDVAGFIFDEVAGTALTENDAAAARIDSKRAQVLVVEDATTRGQRAAVNSSGGLAVTPTPHTSGGLTVYRLLSANTTNSNNVKNSAGQVFGAFVSNTNASPRWLKLYNKATAPTVGTDTPVMTLMIPGNANGAGFALPIDLGVAFSLGIGVGITTGVADNDTGAVAANEVVVNLFYK